MAEGEYFVRSKGRITGPFNHDALQRLVRRGVLSRFDELSGDRASWSSAGEFAELFPHKAAPGVASASSTTVAVVAEPQTRGGAASGGTTNGAAAYYYSKGGSEIGPVSAHVLRSLAETGTLRSDDMVWTEHAVAAVTAGQIPHLTGVFSRPGASAGRPDDHESLPGQVGGPTVAAAMRATATEALLAGLVCGGVLLLAAFLPLAHVDGRLVWWWTLFSAPDGHWMASLCLYGSAAALVLGVLTPVAAGAARAVPMLCLGAAGIAFWVFLGALSPATALDRLSSILLFLLPPSAALLITFSRLRVVPLLSGAGRQPQGVFSGCAVVVGLGLVICLAAEAMDSNGPAPMWAWTVLVLMAVGAASLTAAGILGLVAATRAVAKGINIAIAACAGTSVLLALVSTATALIGLSSLVDTVATLGGPFLGDPGRAGEGTGWFAFLMFRVAAMYYAYVILTCASMRELLAGLYLPKASG